MPHLGNVARPIMMVGAGRSGTSWLMDMMFRHPDVDVVVDNTVLGALYRDAYNSWWTPAFLRVHCAESESVRQVRVGAAIRAAYCELFPGGRPAWITKAIWDGTKPGFGGVPNDFRLAVFPEARYLHFCRSPLTCIPSIYEYFAEQGQMNTIAKCEDAYCSAHRDALRIRDAGVPYLQIRQEDIRQDPAAAWERICAFAGVALAPLDLEALAGEVNASESMRGRVQVGRKPVSWSDLQAETLAVAREIGYAVPAGVVPRESDSPGPNPAPADQATIDRLVAEKRFLQDELAQARAAVPRSDAPRGAFARFLRAFHAR